MLVVVGKMLMERASGWFALIVIRRYIRGNAMNMLIKQLKTTTAGRYNIVTAMYDDGVQLDCLDLHNNVVERRRLSKFQIQNKTLLTAVYADLRAKLGC